MHGGQFLARPLGKEEAGHLGRNIQKLAAFVVTQGQVQERCAVQLDLTLLVPIRLY